MADSFSSSQADGTGSIVAEWRDSDLRRWQFEADGERIMLVSGDDVLELPRAAWPRDIYVAAHGEGYIVRFETFDHSVGFLLSSEEATPLLQLLGRQAKADRREAQRNLGTDATPSRTELLWPKVSPLAVWALILAAPSFIPVLGWLLACGSVALLIVHRRTVRRSAAWSHSRALCWAAVAFLMVGLPVSGLACAARWQTHSKPMPVELRALHSSLEPGDTGKPTGQTASRASVLATNVLDEEHNWGLVAAALLVVLLSLTIHEAAHAISAWWLGDDFAKRMGRVTLNPIPHIDLIGTIVMPLILFLVKWPVFGWAKPVPVRTDVLERPRRGHILISLAGPGSNLLLAAASLMLLLGIGSAVALLAPHATIENIATPFFEDPVKAGGFALAPVVAAACTVLRLSFIVNTFLAFFNLIPIPPLDGSWVLEHLFPRTLGPIYERMRPYAFLVFVALFYSGALDKLLAPAFIAMGTGLGVLHSCLPFI